MPKNIEDMIVPERKRSIRNIPIPEGRRKNNKHVTPVMPEKPTAPETKFDDFHPQGGERKSLTSLQPTTWRSRKGLWLTAGVALLILIFPILSLFSGATLSYIPKSTTLSFDNNFYTAWSGEGGELLYSVIKLSEERGLEVSASGEKEVSRKASGTIIVYNNASTKSQRLRATTRFETSDGKVYQVEDAISVPGKSLVGGVEKPGTLEVVVYAEFPGAEFNIGLADFTLPGLEGSSLFSSIYARSKTEMSGGFAGTERIVSNEDQSQVEIQLKTILKDELISEATVQVPEGFILLPSLSSVTFENLAQTNSTSKNNTMVNMRGNLYGVMFKEGDLSTYLAREKIALTPDELVDIVELESLDFSLASSTVDILLSDEIKFSVSGEAVVLWRTDEIALKADLMGRHKRDMPSILSNYPTIFSATATIRPFWKRSFPDDSTKISIKKLDVK